MRKKNPLSFEERLARAVGSWKFIGLQSAIIAVWILYNSVCLIFGIDPFDQYPFVLLNLFFSTEAAYASPIILMAQVSQANREKDKEKKMEQLTVNTDKNTEAILILAQDAQDRDKRLEGLIKHLVDTVVEQSHAIQDLSRKLGEERGNRSRSETDDIL